MTPDASNTDVKTLMADLGAAAKAAVAQLAGDFNTPHTSIYFAQFRRAFKNVFEETGNGWFPTWSGYIPILALDHIWLSPHLYPVRTEYHRNSHSDHAMIVTQIVPAQ